MASLICFSGGLDSMAASIEFIRQHQYSRKYILYHCSVISERSNLFIPQFISATRNSNILRKMFPDLDISFEHSIISVPCEQWLSFGMSFRFSVAMRALYLNDNNHENIDKISEMVLGYYAEDAPILLKNQDETYIETSPIRYPMMVDIWKAVFKDVEPPKVVYPLEFMMKQDLIELVPKESIKFTLTCDYAVHDHEARSFSACNICLKCEEKNKRSIENPTLFYDDSDIEILKENIPSKYLVGYKFLKSNLEIFRL